MRDHPTCAHGHLETCLALGQRGYVAGPPLPSAESISTRASMGDLPAGLGELHWGDAPGTWPRGGAWERSLLGSWGATPSGLGLPML